MNQHHFRSLADARTIIEMRRPEYNTERPHQGLRQRTPAAYAALFTPVEEEPSPMSLRL